MGYLDKEGLSYFWRKVRTALSGKQEQLTPDESLVLDGGNISVKIPTRHLTRAEYNALTEEEKQTDILYIVPGDNPGGADWEIYSTKEIPVGIWIDGKTICRRVFPFTTPASPSAAGEFVWNATGVRIADVETLISAKILMSSSDGYLSAGQSTNNLSIEGGRLLCSIQRYDTLCSRPAFAVVEYTKTDG
ncbi:hypothetical protein AALC17_20425 [Oscillospiraceae bacterium 38-13]